MPAYARSRIVPPDDVAVYHSIARCVRRAFLCGVDPLTKHDYEHRKEWIRERLELLASVFAIDICGYAVMSNIGHGWIETVRQFGRRFKTAVGRPDALAALAARRGKAWLQGSNAAALAFR